MGLYIQHGYGKSTKIDSAIGCGITDGVIFSPKSEKPENLSEYIQKILHEHEEVDLLVDPQFYLFALQGNINRGKLDQYEFGFSSATRKELSIPSNIQNYVESILSFQNNLGLRRVISPTVIFNSFDSSLSQISLSLANESIRQVAKYKSKEMLVSLCINESCFDTLSDVQDFLDIITLFETVGFYIIIDRDDSENLNSMKRDRLANLLYFCYNLASINDFEVIVGYSDYMGLLLYATGISAIATGWFNSMRKFSSSSFIPKTGGKKANKRYSSNVLLNSILVIPEFTQMLSQRKLQSRILSNTRYDKRNPGQWTDEQFCLHHWESIRIVMKEIDEISFINDKITFIKNKIDRAMEIYSELPNDLLDSKSRGTHLAVWKEALTDFESLM